MAGRAPGSVMIAVWKALMIREATFRLFGSRAAWAWLLAEPLAHFALLTFIFTAIRQRSIGGIEIELWLILGLFGFFTFRRTANQVGGAFDSNRGLFAYRQVQPIDTAIVRGLLEGLIMIVALWIVAGIMALAGYGVAPDRPLALLAALAGLWLLGGSFGLIAAMLAEFADEARQVLRMTMMPLYFISGVLFPASAIPVQYRDFFLLNPIFHGLEAARSSFSTYYHAPPEIDLSYLYIWALCSLGLGLLLYRRIPVTYQAA